MPLYRAFKDNGAFNNDAIAVADISLLIEPIRLQALLGRACGRFDVDSIAECESTNTLLLERAALGAPAGWQRDRSRLPDGGARKPGAQLAGLA